ncbi:MAG: tRNA lysidine(34) synthetase TilS, partial [Arsenophonus sp. ET-DL12-MAG3]
MEDESNLDQRYDRNFLRLTVIPHLNQRWPYFLQAVSRSASLCAEQEILLTELLKDCLSKLITIEGSLQLNPLMSF